MTEDMHNFIYKIKECVKEALPTKSFLYKIKFMNITKVYSYTSCFTKLFLDIALIT